MTTDSNMHERMARIETTMSAMAESLRTLNTRMDIIGDLALGLARIQERVDMQAEELSAFESRLTVAETEIPLIRERFSNWVSVNKGVVLSAAAAATLFSWFLLRIVSDYDSQLTSFRDQYTNIDRRISWVEYSIYKDPKNQSRKEIPVK